MLTIALDTYQLHNLAVELPCKTKSIAGLAFPDVRLDQYAKAGTHGVTIAHNLYGGRLITLEGTIRASTGSSYLTNRRALEAAVALRLDANNVPVTRTLWLTDLEGGTYSIPVVTKSFQADYDAPGITWGRWQLQLQAADFTISSAAISNVALTLPIAEGLSFATGGGSTTGYINFASGYVTFGASSGGTAIASNTGNTAAYPVVTIAGPVTNPTLANDSTGESLKLNLSLLAGDTVVIDMARRTVVQGGSTNRMGAKAAGSTFWAVQPGNNTLRFSADAYDSGNATVTYSSQYLGL